MQLRENDLAEGAESSTLNGKAKTLIHNPVSSDRGDPLPRPRTADGATYQPSFGSVGPLVGPEPLKGTELQELLDMLAQKDPIPSKNVEQLHRRVRFHWEVLDARKNRTKTDVEARRRHCETVNPLVYADLEKLYGQRRGDLAPIRMVRIKAAERRRTAEEKAAKTFAKAKAVFDPSNATIDSLLGIKPASNEAIAAKRNLPYNRLLADLFDPPKFWVTTAFTGATIGISIAARAGWIDVMSPWDSLRPLVASAVIGFAVWLSTRLAITAMFAHVAQAIALRFRTQRWGFLITSAMWLLLFITIAALVDREGILRLGGPPDDKNPIPPLAGFIIGMIMTLGALLASTYEGMLRGAQAPAMNAIVAAREDDLRDRTAARWNDDGISDAAEALSEYVCARNEEDRVGRSYSAADEKWAERIQQAEGRLMAHVDGPTVAELQLEQDAYHEVVNANKEMDAALVPLVGKYTGGAN